MRHSCRYYWCFWDFSIIFTRFQLVYLLRLCLLSP